MRADLPRGYRMRTATFDDIPAVVAVGKACDLQDIGELDVFEDWIHEEWMRPRFDPSTDACRDGCFRRRWLVVAKTVTSATDGSLAGSVGPQPPVIGSSTTVAPRRA